MSVSNYFYLLSFTVPGTDSMMYNRRDEESTFSDRHKRYEDDQDHGHKCRGSRDPSKPSSDSVAGPSYVSNKCQETIVIEDDENPTLFTTDETIVLDESTDEEEITILNDKDLPSLPSSSKQKITPPSCRTQLNLPPSMSSNIQQFISRYPSSASEFFPHFYKNSSSTRHKADFSIALRNPYNTSGRQESNVWLSSRRHEHANVVVASGPTVFVGDKEKTSSSKGSLRPIVIDGSNVAMSHGVNNIFSVRGIELTIDYFKSRGHKEIVAFLPQWRSKYNQSSDKQLLDKLEGDRFIIFTPSREVDNQRINSYDDTFILVNVVNEKFGIFSCNIAT